MSKDEVLAVPNNGTDKDQDLISIEDSMDVVVARADKQVEVLKKVLGIAVKRTSHYDWTDMQGKPYLTSSGAEKLMPLFGVSVTGTSSVKNTTSDDKGGYYVYQYKGTFSWKAGSIEAIGACSSRDKFFAWDGKTKEYKPLSEVDETNIIKAAYSNMMVRGITTLLGLRNLTWEQLKDFGVDKGKVARVEYGHNTKQATPEEVKKQGEIWTWCLTMAENDREKAIRLIGELTKFKGRDGAMVAGVTSPKRLTGTRLNICHSKTKAEHQKYQDNIGGDK